MKILVDNDTRIVLMAGDNLTEAQIIAQRPSWCFDYQQGEFTVYDATLPAGYLSLHWTYSAAGIWAPLPASQALINAAIDRGKTTPVLVSDNITVSAVLSEDATVVAVDLTWSHVATATMYGVRYRIFGENSYITSTVLDSGEPSTSTRVTGLEINTIYLFSIRAQTQWGMTAWSNEIQIITPDTLTTPSDLLLRLNGDITQDKLLAYLQGHINMLTLLDTGNIVAEPGTIDPGAFVSWTESILQSDKRAYDASQQILDATTRIAELEGEIILQATATSVEALTSRVGVVEVDLDALAGSITLLATQATADSLSTQINSAELDISAALTAISLKASQTSVDNLTGTVSTQSSELDVVKDRISFKLDNNGRVAGMVMGWANPDTSEVIFLVDRFKVCQSDGSGVKQVFTVGTIAGVSTVGINGNLFLDGILTARMIATGQLTVGGNVALGSAVDSGGVTTIVNGIVTTDWLSAKGIIAGSVAAGNITQRSDLFNLVTTSIFTDTNKKTWVAVYNIESSGGSGTPPRPYWLVTHATDTRENVTFGVTPGETLSLACWMESTSGSGSIYFGMIIYNAAGTEISWPVIGLVNAQPWSYVAGTAVMPAGASYAKAWCKQDNAAGWGRFSDMKISRQGSISADLITTGALNADRIASGTELFINGTPDGDVTTLAVDIYNSAKGAVYIRNSDRNCTIPALSVFQGGKIGSPYSAAPAIRCDSRGAGIDALQSYNPNGYGITATGGLGAIRLAPLGQAGTPSMTAGIGSLQCDSNGILYSYTNTGWQKVGAQ